MPARSESCDSRVASGRERLIFTVRSSTTSTLATEVSSLLRKLSGSVRARSILAFTAAASIFSPSWNFTPGRSLKVSDLPSSAPAPLGGEFGRELQVGRDVDELVAQRREHDAADEGARAVRVEHVGIFVQADAQGLRGGRGAHQEPGGQGQGAVSSSFRSPPIVLWMSSSQFRGSSRRAYPAVHAKFGRAPGAWRAPGSGAAR